jgi:hypothetical protein
MIQAESMLARTDGTLNCHFSQFIGSSLQLAFDQIHKTSPRLFDDRFSAFGQKQRHRSRQELQEQAKKVLLSEEAARQTL